MKNTTVGILIGLGISAFISLTVFQSYLTMKIYRAESKADAVINFISNAQQSQKLAK